MSLQENSMWLEIHIGAAISGKHNLPHIYNSQIKTRGLKRVVTLLMITQLVKREVKIEIC